MRTQPTSDEKFAKMSFATVYPLYLAKIIKKSRTEAELMLVISWLTGFKEKEILKSIKAQMSFEAFFEKAKLNPKAKLITGLICGYRVEEIKNPLTQKVRYLDKLVDELAQGKKMEKILRE